ncbi:cation:proton antiporter [Stygiolobus caldivivus]|uniref:Sodium:proton antiporter n=1 Tax=Stygiolobus caldivivus TaxID=2824673 RepID=A0A8D5U6N2_9CREN|nr:cation:proton antiporter [Stygiolobus caldivivus]BCU70294.1 sodium:proton antiporter [Stygiolobus caldivivus]
MVESSDVVYLTLLELFTLLTFAQMGRLVSQRFYLPIIIAEIFVGIALSPYALGGYINNLVGLSIFSVNSYLVLFADFSVVLLIFAAGLSHGFKGLRESGLPGFIAATAGAVIPTYLVYATFSIIYSTAVSAIMGAASAATSLAATSSIIEEYKLYKHDFTRLVISAAALDDVVSLIILSVILEVVSLKTLSVGKVAINVLEIIAAWLIILFSAVFFIPKIIGRIDDNLINNVSLVILFTLVLIMLLLGFSPIIASFVAGVAIAESAKSVRIVQFTSTLLSIFGPVFFIYVGMETPYTTFLNINDLLLGLLMSFLAVIGKIAGIFPVAFFVTKKVKSSLIASVGMLPRGEVGLVVATLGLTSGIIDTDQYSQIIIMAIVTTILGGFLFSYLVRKWIVTT